MAGVLERLSCSCGLPMSTNVGYVYCDHCDKSCELKSCDYCNRLRVTRAKGQ